MQRDPIKSAARTLEILELFQEQRSPLRLIQIFDRLGYPQSSTTALLRSMVVLGYLNYDRRARTYFPTPRVAALGDWVNHYMYGAGELIELLRSVSLETEETAVISSQNDIFVQHIKVVPAQNEHAIPPPEGTMRLLTEGSAGLALLSGMDDKAVDKVVRHINAYVGASDRRVDLKLLNTQLSWIRREGYSFLAGYPLLDAAGIAVPLPPMGHAIPLSIGVGGRNSRISRKKNEIVEVLRRALAVYKTKLSALEVPTDEAAPFANATPEGS